MGVAAKPNAVPREPFFIRYPDPSPDAGRSPQAACGGNWIRMDENVREWDDACNSRKRFNTPIEKLLVPARVKFAKLSNYRTDL